MKTKLITLLILFLSLLSYSQNKNDYSFYVEKLKKVKKYKYNEYLNTIVTQRMQQNPHFFQKLLSSEDKLIVNADKYDSLGGVGEDPRSLRWRKDSFLAGRNCLGVLYIKMRAAYREGLQNTFTAH